MALTRFLFAACARASLSPRNAQERVQVVTTTTDLRSLAEAVGGDRIEATSLVPPISTPRSISPSRRT